MIDILLVEKYSASQIQYFLSEVFGCAIDRVKVFDIDAFNALTEELDDFSFDCICVFSTIHGDASQLLQLYRYKVSNADATNKAIEIAIRHNISCYVPSDTADDWVYVGKGESSQKHAQQIENNEDDYFKFKIMQ